MADFRESFHVGLYEVAPWEAAELLARLPASSRTASRLRPDLRWPEEREYLALVEYWLHAIVWSMQPRASRGPRPEPLVPEALRARDERVIKGVMTPVEEIERMFRRKGQ